MRQGPITAAIALQKCVRVHEGTEGTEGAPEGESGKLGTGWAQAGRRVGDWTETVMMSK